MDVMLQPGDVFLTRSTSLLGRLIRFCTRSFGEKRSKVNHVGIVVEAGDVKKAVVVEALS